MQELNLIVLGDVSAISTNFEEIKNQVAEQVKKYSLEVTEDNIPEAKRVMANFNKVKTEIGNKYKEYIDKLSTPINRLKEEKREIEAIITDGRAKISEGVTEFENKKLEIIHKIIQEYINAVCEEKGLNSELISVNEFVKLTAITPNGTLAKATKDAIDAKISALENEILKAKLQAQEKARQRESEILATAQREKQEAIERARTEAEERAKELSQPPKVAPKQTDDGKYIYTVRALFEVKADKNVEHSRLCEAIDNLLKKAGINECVKIEVLNA